MKVTEGFKASPTVLAFMILQAFPCLVGGGEALSRVVHNFILLACVALIRKQRITFSIPQRHHLPHSVTEKIWKKWSASLQINGLNIIKLLSSYGSISVVGNQQKGKLWCTHVQGSVLRNILGIPSCTQPCRLGCPEVKHDNNYWLINYLRNRKCFPCLHSLI